MSSNKLIQILKDIDLARCNGNWQSIPDLARRYKKYNPEGIVLEQALLVEYNLIQIINNTRSANTDYQSDGPGRISMECRLNLEQVLALQNQIIYALNTSDNNPSQKGFARIIMARCFYEAGEYDEALLIIEKLSFDKDDVSQGYGFILFLQARVMKAISYEIMGKDELAIQHYIAVESLLQEVYYVRNKSLIEWTEEAFYRAILLSLKKDAPVNVSTLINFIRRYQLMTSNQPLPWRLQKRLVIIREAVVFISRVYRKGEYTLPEGTLDNDPENNIQFIKQYFITEQSELHTLYERLLYMSTPFSKAGQVNTHVLDFVNQFAIDFELIGSTAHDLRGFVEVLDRASERTFNSPTITRHLFHALVRLGEYEEAEYALHSYLYLVRLVSFGWKEKRKNGVAVSIDNTGKNKPVPSYDILLDAEECGLSLPEIEGAEVEDVSSILNVLVIATKMLCQEVSKGSDAVEVAGLALKLYQKQPKSDRSNKLKGLGAEVYKSVGVAYGVLGRQTVDPDLRPVYHEKAISALNYALEIDPTAWKTYYQLGLQQAEMHDINQAVQYVTQVLQIIPNHLPSWHLLTLLISCSSQGDYRQAMRTCDMGFQQIESLIDNTPDLNLHTSPLYEEAEQQLIFQITRTLLLCAYKGPDLALQFSKTVFTSYGKISIPHDSTEVDGAHNNMIISGSLGNLDELQMAAAQQRRRGRSISNVMLQPTDISHSKSYENMLSVQTTQSLNIGRARSSSNLAARAMNTGSLLTVPNEAEAKHQHSLHLFSSRSLGYRLKTPGEPNSPINGSSVSVASSVYNPELKASASNSVASLQSMAHSVWSVQSILQPSNVPTKPSTRSILRKRRSEQTLSDLWLLTAKMYLKNKELDKAKSAVEEAEKVDWEDHPHLWCVYGQIMLAENKVERAQSAFYKGLSIDPQNIQCNLWLAKVYMIQNKLDSAEALLDASSKSNGWDSAEVWFHLGEIYRQQSRLDRTKACLFYALELESTTPIQPFSILPCFI